MVEVESEVEEIVLNVSVEDSVAAIASAELEIGPMPAGPNVLCMHPHTIGVYRNDNGVAAVGITQ